VSQRESWPGEEPEADGEDEADVADEVQAEEAAEAVAEAEPEPEEADADEVVGDEPQLRVAEVPADELAVPDDVDLLEGEPRSLRRGVGIVVARTNLEVANKLLDAALAELDRVGIGRETITVMAVPGPFELPLGAMALAKTRRYACVVALGCFVRGETVNFELVTGEAASGLQLAALETGVPVAFGVLAVDELEQAADRLECGADAVRSGLEMADLFQQLRESAQASK
jgi:6,7-dimethyl-8-ribityllumazine synthase